jgi:hypothetical protein
VKEVEMRYLFAVGWLLLSPLNSADAQVDIQIGAPSLSIGINVPIYPRFVRVPGYPVYYAPGVDSNYFFYDGLYWVYLDDSWYASSWYNGPWSMVGPEYVPVFVLRVPVRYYRRPPPYFRPWRPDAPPRWGEHWGNDWERRRGGWDRWDRRAAPAPSPLPVYQRRYAGDRYPRAEEQRTLHGEHYRYQPRDDTARQVYERNGLRAAPPPSQRGNEPPGGGSRQRDGQQARPPTPHAQPGTNAPHEQPGRGQERVPDRGDGHQGRDKDKDKDKGRGAPRPNPGERGGERERGHGASP